MGFFISIFRNPGTFLFNTSVTSVVHQRTGTRGARAHIFTNMGVARKRKSKHAAGRLGPVKKKYQRDAKTFKLGGRPRKREVTKPDTEASVSKPSTRSGVYYHEIWWGLRRIRARFPSEWPTIGTKIITCLEDGDGGGVFASAAVTRVKPCGKRDSIHVAFDDGRKEVTNLKKYHH